MRATRDRRPRLLARAVPALTFVAALTVQGLAVTAQAEEPAPAPTGTPAGTPAGTPDRPAEPGAEMGQEQRSEQAEETLEEVQAILSGQGEPAATGGTPADPGTLPPGRLAEAAEPEAHLSLALRDLGMQLDDLGPADRREARRILARPTSSYQGDYISYLAGAELKTSCGPQVCVHWVDEAPARGRDDTPPRADTDGDGVPDQVQLTLRTFENVRKRTVAMGYRPPLVDDVDVADPDARGRFDVYLADLGSLRPFPLFGYCAWESKAGYDYAGAGYCVVDNDFSARQFKAPPRKSLRETIAHEFFHAVQFAYDAVEDLWFMESTATWIEDELYDRANGNRNYLDESQLAFPNLPIDDPLGRYGNWVFMRWLSERFGPSIVLQAWRQADSVAGPDKWGLQAIDTALRARGTTLAAQLPRYAVDLRFAKRTFEEGGESKLWRPASAGQRIGLSRQAPVSQVQRLVVRQTGSQSLVVPTRDATSGMRRLVVAVKTPARARGVRVKLVQVRSNGKRVVRPVKVDKRGSGTARIGFVRSNVDRVLVLATATSYRMVCWQRPPTGFSCDGARVDDNLPVAVQVAGRR
ncbi:hypothetical protein KLP28_12425 [Nocardioidaceae bacterium]|nr:hypothetical protein KLP28_12425 [Nocardioidaceae bacterium]